MLKRTVVLLAALALPSVAQAQLCGGTICYFQSGGVISTPLLLPDGTAAAPSVAFLNYANSGLFTEASVLAFSVGGVKRARLTADYFDIYSTAAGIRMGASQDVILTRSAAATLQQGGPDAAAPGSQTLQAQGVAAGTSDVAGASYTFKSGTGRGTGAGSALIFSSPTRITTGSTAQTQVERVRIDEQATQINTLAFPLVADATIQYGQTVMPDAGTNDRFDVTTGSATLTIGVLGGVGASAQGTSYPVIYGGLAYVACAEDGAITRGHYLLQSATAGYCADSATVSTDGLNIAKALRSEPVTNVIVFNGCTGAAGCVNTALNTPNNGPAGQITLSADVAAAGWVVGEPVVYWNSGGGSITGLTDGATYWLVSVATTNVLISATKGGAAIVPSSQGNDATQYLQRLTLAAISIQ
jgi:hypothetical protein